MLVFPQLTQFPVQKRRQMRTVINTLGDLTAIKLDDPHGATIEWQLQYSGLSDAEASSLQQFYLATEGSLNTFTFLDPMANLFAWSDQLDNETWAKDPFLGLTAGNASTWRLTNSGAGPQSIRQTLNAPGGYIYRVSISARGPATVSLLLGGNSTTFELTEDWRRISLTGQGDSNAASIALGLQLPAGASLDVFGMQVEAQAAPSAYKASTTGGVYETAYFRDDSLSFTSTDVNRNSVTVNIAYAIR